MSLMTAYRCSGHVVVPDGNMSKVVKQVKIWHNGYGVNVWFFGSFLNNGGLYDRGYPLKFMCNS